MNDRKLVDVLNIDIDLLEDKSLADVANMFSELNSESQYLYKDDGTDLKIEFRDVCGGFINFSVSVDMTAEEIEYEKQRIEQREKDAKREDMKELKKLLTKYNLELKE